MAYIDLDFPYLIIAVAIHIDTLPPAPNVELSITASALEYFLGINRDLIRDGIKPQKQSLIVPFKPLCPKFPFVIGVFLPLWALHCRVWHTWGCRPRKGHIAPGSALRARLRMQIVTVMTTVVCCSRWLFHDFNLR